MGHTGAWYDDQVMQRRISSRRNGLGVSSISCLFRYHHRVMGVLSLPLTFVGGLHLFSIVPSRACFGDVRSVEVLMDLRWCLVGVERHDSGKAIGGVRWGSRPALVYFVVEGQPKVVPVYSVQIFLILKRAFSIPRTTVVARSSS
ncbi:hypothetical protein vseg_000938 [Gypsophila vaccaria]